MISAQGIEEGKRGKRTEKCPRVKVCKDKKASRGRNHKRRLHWGHKSSPIYLRSLIKKSHWFELLVGGEYKVKMQAKCQKSDGTFGVYYLPVPVRGLNTFHKWLVLLYYLLNLGTSHVLSNTSQIYDVIQSPAVASARQTTPLHFLQL